VNWKERWWERDEFADRLEEKLADLGSRAPQCGWGGCDEICPFMLTGADPEIYCYEHELLRLGRSWLERHHPPGRHNHPASFATPGNDHRVLSEFQLCWPRETLRNPDGSPLLQAAALVRGYLDLLYLVMLLTVPVPVLLEQLDAFLRERIDGRWWEEFESWLDANWPEDDG
jgi:hypothetical protein